MTDPDIRRWLARQTRRAVGHVPAACISQGWTAIRDKLESEGASGKGLIVVDALTDEDLMVIGRAARDSTLVTGGSGVAIGLPENFCARGMLAGWRPNRWRGETGRCAVLSGSCSTVTLRQIESHSRTEPTREVTASAVIARELRPATVARWILAQEGVPLAFSSAEPGIVVRAQREFGRDLVSERHEEFFAEVAKLLVDGGIRRLIVAGGETSGAVVERLQFKELEIGPEIANGVPAMRATADLVLALRSGNFGGPEFFNTAAIKLAEEH
jgi:uncharacterized protein YgbK (DUF1537 family)